MRAPCVVLGCLSLIACLGLLASVPCEAQVTSGLRSLTVEEARSAAGVHVGRLNLDGLTALPPDVAAELAKHEGWLSLDGLKEISDASAAALGPHRGALHLNGLAKISDAAAASLAGVRHELSLNGLTAVSDESARALARHTGGRLLLKGLTTLSGQAGQAFAGRKGGGPTSQTILDGLTSLSPEAAAALAESHPHNWQGHLPGFRTLPVDVAQALAKRQGGLSMPGLTTLSDEAARVIGGKLGGNLPRLTALTVESAKAIVGPNRTLVLNGLTSLPDDVAAVIGGKNSGGHLHLGGLTSLSPFAAKEIGQRYGDLHLDGLAALSDETLKALAEHKAGGNFRPIVHLRGLTTLSDDGAALLSAWPKWSGELPRLASVSPQSAAALASSRNWDGRLPAVRMLSAEAARALAAHRGTLALDGPTTLSDDVAAALAEHADGPLALDGLKSLSDGAAAALARHAGRLSLGGLETLSDAAARGLAEHRGDWLFLDGLTTLSETAARALARHPGTVSLLGVQSPADGTLRALRANPRIVLADRLRRLSVGPAPQKTDEPLVRAFLKKHCTDCHDGGANEGEFVLDRLAKDDVTGRVAYASIFERLRAGDMPPPGEPQPDPAAVAGVVAWIGAKLDAPLPGPPAPYAVKEKPVDGNRLPHAILFGGPRGPSVPPPPRLWRLSPVAYTRWTGEFNSQASGLQQPFGTIQEPGFRDFAALYTPDEGATGLLLTNAELIVAAQTRGHATVNVNENPAAAKENLWPGEARAKAASPAEQELLKGGLRVRQGNGTFAPLLHPQVKATREELERSLRAQYLTAVARPPSAQELASLVALYDDIAAAGDAAIAGKTVLMAPLMTPEAILRFEVGLGPEVRPGVRSLSPRETALAISLALSTKRDPGLLAAAAEGKLTTREEVAASVRRILDDPKIGKPLVTGFFREFFDYHRAPEVFKDPLPDHLQRRGVYYNPRGSVDDTDVLVLRVLSRDRDVLTELLTTPESFATHELFGATPDGLRVAGQSGEPLFRPFGPYALDHLGTPSRSRARPKSNGAADASDGERIGLPMQRSWQVAWSTNFHNDIVRRGRWIREHLLGGRVPDLPIDAAAMIPDDPHRTLRERQMVTRAAACWKCHYRMDELGLPFEDVTHYGFPRRTEEVLDLEAMARSQDKNAKLLRGAPLDTTGFVRHSGDPALDGPVRDAPEMLRRLAGSDRVRQVFVRHAFRYFLGRNETPGDAVSLQEAEKAYIEGGGSFQALLVSLLSSESFLYRSTPVETSRR